jgi:hypothetical protein
MGVRRERPPIERSSNSVTLRLPDGTVRSVAGTGPFFGD